MGRSHGRLHHTEFIDIVGVIAVVRAVTVTVEISIYYRLRVSIVLLCILLFCLHPSPSYLSVIVSDQVVIRGATQVHKTIVWRDNLRFGNILLRSVWRQGFITESIQFLIVLEFMFQKVPEANSINQYFSSRVRIQCMRGFAHLSIYVFIFFSFKLQ